MPLPITEALPPLQPGSCALPIWWPDFQSQDSTDLGFLIYPAGTQVNGPVVKSTNGFYYDPAMGAWLPVRAQAVSPDGTQYAYADYDLPPPPAAGMAGEARPRAAGALATTGRVHLIDARTGADRILYSGSPTYAIAGFTADGVYLTHVTITMDGGFFDGLFLIKTSGGTPVAVQGGNRGLDRGGWTIFNGAAWGTEFTAGLGGITLGNELVEMDLHTAAVTVWLTAPEGTALAMLGFDPGGHPLVSAYASGYSSTGSPAPTPPTQLLELDTPQHPTALWQVPGGEGAPPFPPAFDDSHGAWMGGQDGLWLLSNGKAMRIGAGGKSLSVLVANSCLTGG